MFNLQSESIERILVFRALKLGDMLCSIPTLRAIRRSFPQAEICLVSHPGMESLFERYKQYVDVFIPFPGYPGMPEQACDPKEVISFIREMQKKNFDLAFQLNGSGEISNPLVFLFGAKKTIGHYRKNGFCPDEKFYRRYPEELNEVHRCLSLLDVLSLKNENEELEFSIWDSDKEVLLDEFKMRGITLPRKFVCIHPGASTYDKCWQPLNFARVADELIGQGFEVVFTGCDKESDLVNGIMKRMSNEAIDAASINLPLGALGWLISQCSGLICNDTGVSHLCAALKRPSVVIFTKTDPKRWAPLDQNLHQALVQPTVSDVILKVDRFLFASEYRNYQETYFQQNMEVL